MCTVGIMVLIEVLCKVYYCERAKRGIFLIVPRQSETSE